VRLDSCVTVSTGLGATKGTNAVVERKINCGTVTKAQSNAGTRTFEIEVEK